MNIKNPQKNEIFDPKDTKGRRIPTEAGHQCHCGGLETYVEKDGESLIRRCRNCHKMISVVSTKR